VLDIGAGSGVYSIPFALRSPKVRITAFGTDMTADD